MSALAILRQQSSALTGSLTTIYHMLSGIVFTLEIIKSFYHKEPLRVVDGDVDYHPPQNTTGMAFDLRDISFTYPGSKSSENAIKNITLQIRAGQLVVIVGANGSGKSTLVRLLTRTYDVTSGEILIDGSLIKSYKISGLRDATAVLNQNHVLYPLSMAENIGVGYSEHATDYKAIGEAVKRGGASEVIASMKEGLSTDLEPSSRLRYRHGIELPRDQTLQDIVDDLSVDAEVSESTSSDDISGGEKQRLVASRTFMRLQNPNIRFVAVDEPSSALDPRGELELFDRLRAEQKGKTMIFVTHRFGHLTKYADLIICMKNGEVIESGSHKDLLALKGEYATLYNIQAQAFVTDQESQEAGSETPPNVDNVDHGGSEKLSALEPQSAKPIVQD
ncbi:hypothetical protein H0H92_012830 [Tricholoma furcatifolium]|nr:hypothetical protein H0H92_012830 [Tricholoma furcatifolium]